LPSLGSLLHFELHSLSFLQALEASRLNGGEVNEYVFTTLSADKAEAFRIVKPLNWFLVPFCFFLLIFLRWTGIGGTQGRTSWFAGVAQQPSQIKPYLGVSDLLVRRSFRRE